MQSNSQAAPAANVYPLTAAGEPRLGPIDVEAQRQSVTRALADARATVLIEIETQGVANCDWQRGQRVPIAIVVDADAERRAAFHRLDHGR
jgi:hypothetical protein